MDISIEKPKKKQQKRRRQRSNSKIVEKVSDEDFVVPELNEYEKINRYNYNVKQLKAICKHYKLKISGNKNELKKRILNYMINSIHAITIQKILRGFIVRTYIKLHGPGLFDRNKCVNSTDFLSLEDLIEIPFEQFYSFRDNDGFLYGFDICSIYNLYKTNKENTNNPYNRKKFPDNTLNNLKKIYKYGKLLGFKTNIKIEYDEPQQHLSNEEQLNARFLTLFQTINEMGFYADHNWLLSLSLGRKIRFIRELYDIWIYRANLTNEIRTQICNTTLFHGINLFILNTSTNLGISQMIYNIINKLVTSSPEQNNRWLGASYALTALTLVSQDAAEALPWLYESVL